MALDLMDLPDELLHYLISVVCPAISTFTLAQLYATCRQLKLAVTKQARALLDVIWGRATTLALRAIAAESVHNLSRLLGLRPLIPMSFFIDTFDVVYYMRQDCEVDMAALERLYLVFAYVPDTGSKIRGSEVFDAFEKVIQVAVASVFSTSKRLKHIRVFDVQRGINFILNARKPLPVASQLDMVTPLDTLNPGSNELPDDDDSPDFEDASAESFEMFEPPKLNVVGVTLDDEWYPCKDAYFDDEDAFYDNIDGDDVPDPWDPDFACRDRLCCHNAACFAQHGSHCVPASAVRLQAFEAACTETLNPMEKDALYRSISRFPRTRIPTSVDQAAMVHAHKIQCELPFRAVPKCMCPCTDAEHELSLWARHAQWRREGLANPDAKLAELGITVVENVPVSKPDDQGGGAGHGAGFTYASHLA